MIGKIARMSGTFKSLLTYCLYDHDDNKKINRRELRGTLIYAQHVDLAACQDAVLTNGAGEKGDLRFEIDELAKQMQEKAGQNSSVKKPVWHQIFSFPVGEEPTPEQEQAIIDEWVGTFGFADNQVLAFRHTEKEHVHFHIVGNRVSLSGINTSLDQHNYRETGRLCRRLESRLGLQATTAMRHDRTDGRLESTASNQHETLRRLIDQQLENVISQEDFIKKMHGQGYKVVIGRGVTFVDRVNGSQVKGSELGRSYSLQHLQRRMAGEQGAIHTGTSYNQSKRSEALRSELTRMLNDVPTVMALRERLASEQGLVSYYKLPTGQLSLAPVSTGTLVIGQPIAGQLRFQSINRLLSVNKGDALRLRLNQLPMGYYADDTLMAHYESIYRSMFVASFRYHAKGNRPIGDVVGTMMATTNWRINREGSSDLSATLLADRQEPGDAAGQPLYTLQRASLLAAFQETHGASQEQRPHKPARAINSPTEGLSVEPTVWASGGAQMDRDTRADLAEIERSLKAQQLDQPPLAVKPKPMPSQPAKRRRGRRL